jgi:hypothetical protein
MPLDRLLAESESKSVSGVFFTVQTLKHLEYAALECQIYTWTVVLHGEHPIEIHTFRRNVNARRRPATVLDGISNQVVQDFGQYFEVSAYPRQRVMGDGCAPFCYLLVRAEEYHPPA